MLMRLLFGFSVGLLPLWVFIINILLKGPNEGSPFVFAFAVIPGCGASLVIVSIAFIVYDKTKGNRSKKIIISATAVTIFTAIVGLFIFSKYSQHEKKEQAEKEEWVLVQDFVRNNNEIIHATGGVKSTSRDTCRRMHSDQLPFRYSVRVEGLDTKVYAIVDVSRQKGIANFSLACFTFLPVGYRDHKDECKPSQ